MQNLQQTLLTYWKATQRLYFLKQLRRAGIPQAQLLHFYTAVIRPVLEYAAPVWNHLLNKTQIDQIEAIQRRALRIIYSYTSDMSYTSALYCTAVASLAYCREHLARKFFKSILDPSSGLLPTPRDPSITTRLRCTEQVPLLPHPYQKIPDIYLLRSIPLPICTFINFLFVSLLLYIYIWYAFYTDILYPSVVLWLAVVLLYCAIWSHDHQVE